VRQQFDEKQLSDLTLAVVAINGWKSEHFENGSGRL